MTDCTKTVSTPILLPSVDGLTINPSDSAIEDLSRQLAMLVHERRYLDPLLLRHIDPNILASFEDFPESTTSTEYLGTLAAAAIVNPKYALEVMNTCSAVDKIAGIGTVWVTMIISFLPKRHFRNVHRETVVRLDWRRMERGWIAVTEGQEQAVIISRLPPGPPSQNTSPKHTNLAMSSETLPQNADGTTSITPSAPVIKAYSIPGHYAWHIYSTIRHMTHHTTVRDVVAAQRDNTPQLLFVCSQETLERSVAWIYATFGDPDKYNFHFSGAQTLDCSMDDADRFTGLVGFFAERIGVGARLLEVGGEEEGTGWEDIMALAAARVEKREEPANARDIEEHFTNVVIPRLLRAARETS
ncbi:hypothetical protein LTR17_001776 [Elasticomyces elasticus]|nr:hypothetical protein LTR17_001776 [Elasticomyces elasticus]